MFRLSTDSSKKTVYTMSLDAFDMELLQKYGRKRSEQQEPSLWSVSNLYKRSEKEYYEFEITVADAEASTKKANEEFRLKTYVKLINEMKKSDQFSIKVNSKGKHRIVIQTASGDAVTVLAAHFHGLSSDGAHCKVCRALVADVTSHLHDIRHVALVTELIRDKHCIRQISPVLNHCILCNEIIENPEIHIRFSFHHKTNLNNAFIDNYSKDAKLKPVASIPNYDEEIIEEVLNEATTNTEQEVYVDSTEPCVQISKFNQLQSKSTGHSDAYVTKDKFESVILSKNEATRTQGHLASTKSNDVPQFYHYHGSTQNSNNVPTSNTKERQKSSIVTNKNKARLYYCKVCNLYLTNDERNIEEHNLGTSHRNKLNEDNNITLNIETGEYLLRSTDSRTNTKPHNIQTPEIQSSFEEDLNNISEKDPETLPESETPNFDVPLSLFCNICKVTFPNRDLNKKQHKSGATHMKNLAACQNNSEDSCIVVHQNVATNEKSSAETSNHARNSNRDMLHATSNTDAVNVKEVKQSKSTPASSSNSKQAIKTAKKFMEKLTNKKIVSCKICQVTIPNKDELIMVHVNGSKHVHKVDGFLVANKISNKDKCYYCECCKEDIKEINLQEHSTEHCDDKSSTKR